MGDSMIILEMLHAEETPDAGAAAEGGAPTRVEKRPGMRPFPKCGPTKYPDLEGWEPYKTGLRLCVNADLTATGQQAVVRVAQGGAVPNAWARGGPDDVVLFTALVNGTGAMPDDMMQLLPKLHLTLLMPNLFPTLLLHKLLPKLLLPKLLPKQLVSMPPLVRSTILMFKSMLAWLL